MSKVVQSLDWLNNNSIMSLIIYACLNFLDGHLVYLSKVASSFSSNELRND